MITSTLTSRNQTTIPKAVVEALGLSPSGQLVYEIEEDGRVALTAKSATFASLAGSFARKPGTKARSLEDMDAAIRKQAASRFVRSAR